MSAPVAPNAPAPPTVPRVRRRPAVLLTFLLTVFVTLLVARYSVRHVLPTREWWVKKDVTKADAREHGEYFETVIHSRLSDESKLNLLFDGFGDSRAFQLRLDHRYDEPGRLDPNFRWHAYDDIGCNCNFSATGSHPEYVVGDRYPYLWELFTELVIRVLADPNATRDAHRRALYFFNVAADLAQPPSYEARSFAAHQLLQDRELARRVLVNATPHVARFLTSSDLP